MLWEYVVGGGGARLIMEIGTSGKTSGESDT